MADSSFADLDVEALLARQEEARVQRGRDAAAEAQDPFGRHRWVLLDRLKTASLNGKYAEIVVPANEQDRFGVRVQGDAIKKLIKRCNLLAIDDEKTIMVCRLAASGEESFVGGYIQDTRWPLALLESLHYVTAPVSVALGFPLRMTRVEPRSQLTDRSQFDNQWATFMAVDTATGLAPHDWQNQVGPVVVWRPDGAISSDDMCILNDFLSMLLDGPWSDGTLSPDRDLTPAAWGTFKRRTLENRRENPHIDQYDDLNL